MSDTPQAGSQHPRDVIALDLIISTGADLYLDPAGEPRIRRSSEAPEDMPWPVRSRITEGWVANLFFEMTHRLLTKPQIDRIIICLEGMAARNPQTNMELCDAIESEPVLGLLIQLIRHQQHMKTTADSLLCQLRDLARERPYVLKSPRWPNSTEALGRALRRVAPWLKKADVDIAFKREGRNRWVILTNSSTRLKTEPSQRASSANHLANSDFSENDRSDSAEVANPELEFEKLMKGMIE